MISKHILRVVLLVVLAVSLFTAVQPLHAAGCSNATLINNYGFLVTGTAAGNPVAIVGQVFADGLGTLVGVETLSDNGVVGNSLAVTGTYSISSRCTGTATITPQGGAARSYNLTVVSGGKLQLVGSDSGTVQSGFLEAQATSDCTPSGFKGAYSIEQTGDVIGQGPLAFGGQIGLHGNGTISGIRWGSTNGIISSDDAISGVYKIDQRCFGGAVISINHGGPIHYNLVVVEGQRSVLFIQTDAGSVSSGVWER